MGNICGSSSKVVVPKLSPEEMMHQALTDAFDVYDKNKDKKIQKEELAGVLEKYHGRVPTARQLGKIMSKVDLNQNGVIEFDEFEKMMKGREKTKTDIKSGFASWDLNEDGFITKDELLKVLRAVEPTDDEEIEEILECADIDKDGKINPEEFMNFFM